MSLQIPIYLLPIQQESGLLADLFHPDPEALHRHPYFLRTKNQQPQNSGPEMA